MWESKTGKFTPAELRALQKAPIRDITVMLLMFNPLRALQALVEIMLNGDTVKLTELLAKRQLNSHWQEYADDPEVDERDREYAQQLIQHQP